MAKKCVVFVFCTFLSLTAISQSNKGQFSPSMAPVLSPHHQDEYTFDTSQNPENWTKEKPGMHVSFGSEDKLYFRSEVPVLEQKKVLWEESGWRGERLNAQIVVWSPDTLSQVHFTLHDLKSADGHVLEKNNLKLNLVRYVLSNYPYGAADVTCGPSPYKDVYLMPDRFEPIDGNDRFDV